MSENLTASPDSHRRLLTTRNIFSFALLALSTGIAVTVLTNCGSSSSTTSGPTFTTVYSETLSQAAGCEGCHNPSGTAWASGVRLDFSTQALAYSTLNGAKVMATDAGACTGLLDVVAGNPTSSYLVAMAISSYNTANFAGKSGCTPYAGHTSNLTATEQSDLTGWISAGASNN